MAKNLYFSLALLCTLFLLQVGSTASRPGGIEAMDKGKNLAKAQESSETTDTVGPIRLTHPSSNYHTRKTDLGKHQGLKSYEGVTRPNRISPENDTGKLASMTGEGEAPMKTKLDNRTYKKLGLGREESDKQNTHLGRNATKLMLGQSRSPSTQGGDATQSKDYIAIGISIGVFLLVAVLFVFVVYLVLLRARKAEPCISHSRTSSDAEEKMLSE